MKTDKIWTPRSISELLVEKAKFNSASLVVLEPSIGAGDLAEVIREHLPSAGLLLGIEIDEEVAQTARSRGFIVKTTDFLEFHSAVFDRVIASPPFTKGIDLNHVLHMFQLLKKGGRLVSTMNKKIYRRSDQQAAEFKVFLKSVKAEVYDLPPLSFQSGGSDVDALIVVIDKI